MVRITHETTSATVVQFILGSVVAFIATANSIITSCYGNSGTDCVSNTFVSLLLLLFIVIAYGVLIGIGYLAQAKRHSWLALLLIGLEGCAGVFFLFDAKQSLDLIDRVMNALALLLAIWVAYVAFQLYRARGARIVRSRPRRSADV